MLKYVFNLAVRIDSLLLELILYYAFVYYKRNFTRLNTFRILRLNMSNKLIAQNATKLITHCFFIIQQKAKEGETMDQIEFQM